MKVVYPDDVPSHHGPSRFNPKGQKVPCRQYVLLVQFFGGSASLQVVDVLHACPEIHSL